MSPDCYIFDEFFYFDVTMFFDKKNKIASVTFSGTLSPKNRSKLITELVGEISFYPSYDYLVDLRDTVADETDELSMVKAVNMAYQLSKLLAFHATKLAFVIPHDKQHIKNGKNVVTAL